ncbi:MAG: cell division protein FtsA [Deltaproteobacteria bacterium]|nr:cell division protein FtsA [Deltaproteobacteria bacterium]
MAKKHGLVVGLDIGTTKICAIVGDVKSDGVDVVGIGTYPSKGLKKGVVVDIEATVNSIKKAIDEAELMAGCEIQSVYTGIAGSHIRGFNSHGIVAIKDKEVRDADIGRVIDAACAVSIPSEREVIHILPQEYIVDDQGEIREPRGMCGVRLEAKVHIVTGAVASAQNIVRCAQRCGLNISDIVLEQLASAEAVLSEDEKDLGVALVDIGGGTTDIAIFSGGSIVHTASLSIAGNHLSHDVAVGLRTPVEEAEKLKQRYGCALVTMVDKDETIEVPSIGNRTPRILGRQILCEIIEPRIEEICELIKREIEKTGYEDLLASGLVLTGGTALLPGIVELAEEVIGLPVRRGLPQGVGGLVDVVKSPMFATGVGLVQYGSQHMDRRFVKVRQDSEGVYNKVMNRMKEWLGAVS